MSAFWRGDLARARQYLEGAIEAYDLRPIATSRTVAAAQDPKAVCLVRLAWVDLWTGTPGPMSGPHCSRAGRRSRSSHDAVVRPHLRGDHRGRIGGSRPPAELLGDAEFRESVFRCATMIVGEALRGWLDVCEGLTGASSGSCNRWRARAPRESLHLTYTLLLLARARGMVGELHEGRAATREGLSLSHRRNQRYLEAEPWRVDGELAYRRGDSDAVASLRRAVEVADGQARAGWRFGLSTPGQSIPRSGAAGAARGPRRDHSFGPRSPGVPGGRRLLDDSAERERLRNADARILGSIQQRSTP